jgi:hypothetical protein
MTARRFAAVVATFGILAVTSLGVSPEAHAWMHAHEADHDGHDHLPPPDSAGHFCAVVLAQLGFCDTAPILEATAAPVAVSEQAFVPPAFVEWTAPEHWLHPAQGPPVVQGVSDVTR